MPHFKLPGQNLPFEQVRELKPGLSAQQVTTQTAHNGLDEVLFESEGKTYLALSEKVDLSVLQGHSQVQVSLAGDERPARILAVQDDITSPAEGWAKGQSLGDSLSKAWQGFASTPDWRGVHAISSSVGRWPDRQTAAATAPPRTAPPAAAEPPRPVPPESAPVTAAKAPVELFFTRGDRPPDQELAAFIRSAQHTVDVAAFELHSEVISEAILEAHRAGKQVRVVIDSDYADKPDVQHLKAAGVPFVEDNRSGLMHNKFVVVDRGRPQAAVWTGSMNLTDNCVYRNDNNALILRSPQLAENFGVEFEEMFVDKAFGITSPRFVPHPSVTVGHSKIETYFAAEGQVAGRVTEALNTAQKSIHFMTFSFTHNEMGNVVADKIAQGVTVQGVFDNTQAGSRYSQYHHLKELGADVVRDGNPRAMHHKVFIIDEKTVITGSFNFSQAADRSNDENLLIIEDPEIARRYLQEFRRVHAEGR